MEKYNLNFDELDRNIYKNEKKTDFVNEHFKLKNELFMGILEFCFNFLKKIVKTLDKL